MSKIANRITLSETQLNKFRDYLEQCGAGFIPCTNEFEVMRFECQAGMGVLYRNSKGLFSPTGEMATAYALFKKGKTWKAYESKRQQFSKKHKERLRREHGGYCFYCGHLMDFNGTSEEGLTVTVEHLLSLAHGGTNSHANIVLAHERCNAEAGSKTLREKIYLRDKMRGYTRHD